MAPPVEEILKLNDPNFLNVERISQSRELLTLKISEPDPTWPQTYASLEAVIKDALGPTALIVEHIGSTSVPGLAAKAVIDITIIVPDPSNEDSYVPALETAGFHFIFRQPLWNNHRYLRLYDPPANLHVFGPEDAAPLRDRIFRDWLIAHPEDLKLYAETKKTASAESIRTGETQAQYNARKQGVMVEIFQRAFRSLGYV